MFDAAFFDSGTARNGRRRFTRPLRPATLSDRLRFAGRRNLTCFRQPSPDSRGAYLLWCWSLSRSRTTACEMLLSVPV